MKILCTVAGLVLIASGFVFIANSGALIILAGGGLLVVATLAS